METRHHIDATDYYTDDHAKHIATLVVDSRRLVSLSKKLIEQSEEQMKQSYVLIHADTYTAPKVKK